ncbi:MAG: hypothetical protein HOD63_16200 [Bacteroidetes bacterium]|jgi:hypothetical protein|nr:hypothetical protein [Bacteroidota bacterium]MBT5531121.1 hypothetical protein [Cytophagia bacterium]MBT3421344.1 hypothetical protein [Bacteroidota bacterium]MBT3800309.1 hypothetical protein [Bacteroidota bacterium]MBT3934591.1 hypothetical protein [Bacteroidota bacterium]
MKKYWLFVFFMILLNSIFSQTVTYFNVNSGFSYSNLEFGFDDGAPTQTIKGLNWINNIGLGITTVRHFALGAEANFSFYNTPQKRKDNPVDRGSELRFNGKVFARFGITESFSIKPFFGYNRYDFTGYINENEKQSIEGGLSFMYQKNRIFYEIMFNTFPEYDHLLIWNSTSDYYRIKAFHIPSISFGLNYILDSKKYFEFALSQKNDESYYNKHRGFRIETGLLYVFPAIGLAYEFNEKADKKSKLLLGMRAGFLNGLGGCAELYFSKKHKIYQSEKLHYKLNVGYELGAGVILWSRITPWPVASGFLENEFTRFFIKLGTGTNIFQATLGYKLF